MEIIFTIKQLILVTLLCAGIGSTLTIYGLLELYGRGYIDIEKITNLLFESEEEELIK